MSRARLAHLSALGALLVGLAGCSEDRLSGLCVEDTDCPENFACVEGRCICKSDASCQPNELCNLAGFCQARVGCETSLDCPEGQFCDRTTGNCLDGNRCTSDLQCDIGQVCDTVRFQCVDGCREVGDCQIGAVCVCPGGQQKCDPAKQSCPEGSTCGLGACKTGPCADNSYCRYGESCVEESPGGSRRCVKDTRGPFCEPPTVPPGGDGYECRGDSANFPLIDTSKGFGSTFCGVECGDAYVSCAKDEECPSGQCDATQFKCGCANDSECPEGGECDLVKKTCRKFRGCPWGFGCSDVLILTRATCGAGGQGGRCELRQNRDCATDDDCKGGECDPEAKKCRPLCVGGESDVQGFCTCLEDGDCPRDTCGSDGRCQISLQACDPLRPDSCATIYCKNETDPLTKKSVGYCFIGRNCAPNEGVTCDQVRSGQ
jgi:hypothetical protein